MKIFDSWADPLIDPHRVMLTELEFAVGTLMGESRQRTSEQMGMRNLKLCDDDPTVTNIRGALGELAFCKLYNCYPQLDVTSGKTQKHDCILRGMRIDVKTTHYSGGHLMLEIWKDETVPVDGYALMIGKKTGPYRFYGFISKQRALRANVEDFGFGPGFATPQYALRLTGQELADEIEREVADASSGSLRI